MSEVPPDLVAVVTRVREGESPSATVRTLLGWFGKQRRGSWINARIRDALEKNQITTKPNFEDIWVDANVQFVPIRAQAASSSSTGGAAGGVAQAGGITSAGAVTVQARGAQISNSPPDTDEQAMRAATGEPNVKVGHLEAANRKVISIARDELISVAATVMMMKDYSQLPVMNNERTALGMISWRSIGESNFLGKQPRHVREALDADVKIMNLGDSFHSLVDAIVQYEAVLVRNGEGKICGIVTAEDIALHFKKLSAPFLLIGEIERILRKILGEKLDINQLQEGKDPQDTKRRVEDADDLSFGEAVRLMANPSIWPKLGLTVERNVLIEELNKINELRNDVMHFDPDDLDVESLEVLRRMSNFLQRLAP
jgi:predicted transcriptional regulator